MTLIELIKEIKDQHLDRQQLEAYQSEMLELYSLYMIELADIQKESALFIAGYEADKDITKKRAWEVTKSGQREIELKSYTKILPHHLSSLKSRIYSFI